MTPAPATPPLSWKERLYTRVESYANARAAFAALLAVSFVDASFFPVPPFALLVPMVIASPRRWLRLVLWGTAASVLGSALGYGLGRMIHGGFHLAAIDLDVRVDRFGLHGTVAELLGGNFWVLTLLCLVVPLFKLAAIGSGMVGVPFPEFLAAALLARLIRFGAVGGLSRFGGPSVRAWLLRKSPAKRAKRGQATFPPPAEK